MEQNLLGSKDSLRNTANFHLRWALFIVGIDVVAAYCVWRCLSVTLDPMPDGFACKYKQTYQQNDICLGSNSSVYYVPGPNDANANIVPKLFQCNPYPTVSDTIAANTPWAMIWRIIFVLAGSEAIYGARRLLEYNLAQYRDLTGKFRIYAYGQFWSFTAMAALTMGVMICPEDSPYFLPLLHEQFSQLLFVAGVPFTVGFTTALSIRASQLKRESRFESKGNLCKFVTVMWGIPCITSIAFVLLKMIPAMQEAQRALNITGNGKDGNIILRPYGFNATCTGIGRSGGIPEYVVVGFALAVGFGELILNFDKLNELYPF